MKKLFLFPLLLLLITSCNNNEIPLDPPVVDEDTLFANFENQLKELEGHVKSAEITLERMIDYNALVSIMSDECVKTRYTYNDSYVVEANGTAAFLEDDGVTISTSSEYTMQITNDNEKFYKVTDYKEDDWKDSCETVDYTEAGVALNYNIGFSLDDIRNIEYMRSLTDTLKYEYSYTNFEGKIENNKLHYTYELRMYTIYEGGARAISEKIKYDNTLTIENGVVTSLKQNYIDRKYYGEKPLNNISVVSNIVYTQGEYNEFSGTILPH